MTVDEKQIKEVLNKLKLDFSLTVGSIKEINLDHFSSLEKGDNFRITYVWKFPYPLQSIRLVKYCNSYRLNIVAPQLGPHGPHTETFNCIGLYTIPDHIIPDFTIRPNTLADKFVNLFTHRSIKVKDHQEFNQNYILESAHSNTIEQVIGANFFNLMSGTNDLNVEVKGNACFIFRSGPLDYQYCRLMIQLSEEILKKALPKMSIHIE